MPNIQSDYIKSASASASVPPINEFQNALSNQVASKKAEIEHNGHASKTKDVPKRKRRPKKEENDSDNCSPDESRFAGMNERQVCISARAH